MDCWFFTEMPYPYIPPTSELTTHWVSLSNQYFDPAKGADLYNRYLDEYMVADDAGLDLMVNEHHQTPTSINSAAPLTLAILARQTSKAKLLVLGNPIANRDDPLRIAEEMAMVDCISRGRLSTGFVRGVAQEIFAANTNPTRTVERLWEGIDIVQKAWMASDGPFSYEGALTHRRAINLWPRPHQTPHPPIWTTGSSDLPAIRRAAARGFVFATFLQPYSKVRSLFDAYRSAYNLNGQPGDGGCAFMPLVYVADTEAEAEAGMQELIWYIKAKSEPQYRNPPGYVPVETNVLALRGLYKGRTDEIRAKGLEYQREQGVVMYGTPDQVVAQIKRFYDRVGGFDHLLMMMQAGFLDHERTCKNIRLFAKECYPQVRELARTRPLSSQAYVQ